MQGKAGAPREERDRDLGPQVCPEHLPYLGGFLKDPLLRQTLFQNSILVLVILDILVFYPKTHCPLADQPL